MIANDNKIPIDIISYYIVFEPEQLPNYYKIQKQQKHRMTIPGIKFVLDGSIQGYTAFLSKPYYNKKLYEQFGSYDGHYDDNKERTNSFTDYIIQHHIDGVFHCNGDASADQLIESVRKSQ
jgi:predicted amidohydrolase YtcJ